MIQAAVSNTLRYDPEQCIGCEMCVIVCPHAVFSLNGRLAKLVQPEACMECGACQLNCPTGAIQVDSGTGCASAMFKAALTGQKDVTCGGEEICCG